MSLEAAAGEGTTAAMAATYLINDSLAVGPPSGDAASLFFLARYEATRGFVPVWSEVRTYRSGDDKQALAYLDWLELQGTRFDFVRLFDGTGERLSASRAPDGWRESLELTDRELDWTGSSTCPAIPTGAKNP